MTTIKTKKHLFMLLSCIFTFIVTNNAWADSNDVRSFLGKTLFFTLIVFGVLAFLFSRTIKSYRTPSAEKDSSIEGDPSNRLKVGTKTLWLALWAFLFVLSLLIVLFLYDSGAVQSFW